MQITHDEFAALPNDRPLNVKVEGVPPFNSAMLLWFDGCWEYVVYSFLGWRYRDMYLEIEKHVIYHKLPDDIGEQ